MTTKETTLAEGSQALFSDSICLALPAIVFCALLGHLSCLWLGTFAEHFVGSLAVSGQTQCGSRKAPFQGAGCQMLPSPALLGHCGTSGRFRWAAVLQALSGLALPAGSQLD